MSNPLLARATGFDEDGQRVGVHDGGDLLVRLGLDPEDIASLREQPVQQHRTPSRRRGQTPLRESTGFPGDAVDPEKAAAIAAMQADLLGV